MIEALGLTLVQALLSFAVTRELDAAFPAAVKGMPSWFGQPVAAQVCESGMATGDLADALKEATAEAKTRLAQRLTHAAQAASDSRIREARDEGERELVDAFRSDPGVARFVDYKSVARNQEYRKDVPRTAFVRACVAERDLETYQRARVDALVRQVSRHRSNQADRELDDALSEANPR